MNTGEKQQRLLVVDLARSWGGAQASLCDWLAASPLSFRQHVTALVAGSKLQKRLEALGCTVERVRVGHWRWSIPGIFMLSRDWITLRSRIAQHASQAGSIYLNGVKSGVPMIGLSRSKTPKTVLHLRDVRGSRLADWAVSRRADHLIALTRFQAGMLKSRMGATEDRMSIIPNGVAQVADANPNSLRDSLEIPKDAKVVVLLADFVAWKRHERLLGALALLPGWHGIICGAGRDSVGHRLGRDLKALSRTLLLDARIHFPGHIPVADALAAANVLVSLADDEPFGRTVAEAMQTGLPVVAMERGGPAELLETYDGHILADAEIPVISAAIRGAAELSPTPENHWHPKACAEAIIQLLEN